MKNFDLQSFKTPDKLARTAARAWLDELAAANRVVKPYCVALSGGRIAHKFFAAIAEQSVTRSISLGNVEFFWADERCVAPADPDSNFRVAQESLLGPLNIPGHRIHRIRGEDPLEIAAKNAEAELRGIAPQNESRQPILDLIFLGLGEDGHVASLFPGEPEELVSSPAVYRAIGNSPKPPPKRVTLGYSPIAAAGQVWVLASGAGKEAAFRESLSPEGNTPLARVVKSRSQTKIFSDIALSRATP